ncbi:MAG: aldolase [Methylocystis sp.]|nr:aldolase [Methylocystis sp.]MCA3583819.1 aldolase [Methylocystis sp.]MCA3586492.1 aldolase [Methylocystis sp.]MCA3589907.1 aldolase [Methylocystis sp.]
MSCEAQAREAQARQDIVRLGKSLFDRGLTPGSSGNLSVRLDDGYLFTPTNSCLGFLQADRLSKLDAKGAHISGDKPTKEQPLHFAFYEARPQAMAVAHLHSTYATLLSCLADTDPENALAPITPYAVMRVGCVPLVPYTMPGDSAVAALILRKAPQHPAVLLANHGPVVAGASLETAVFALEELEETARLLVLARGMNIRQLTEEQVAGLQRSFPLR